MAILFVIIYSNNNLQTAMFEERKENHYEKINRTDPYIINGIRSSTNDYDRNRRRRIHQSFK